MAVAGPAAGWLLGRGIANSVARDGLCLIGAAMGWRAAVLTAIALPIVAGRLRFARCGLEGRFRERVAGDRVQPPLPGGCSRGRHGGADPRLALDRAGDGRGVGMGRRAVSLPPDTAKKSRKTRGSPGTAKTCQPPFHDV